MSAHFYDAVVFYASIMRDIQVNGTDIVPVANFIAWAKNYSFESPVSGTVTLDENADRISKYVISLLNPKNGLFAVTHEDGKMKSFKSCWLRNASLYHQYFHFFKPSFSSSPTDPNVVPLGPITWPGRNGTMPPNEPLCGYNGKRAICAPSKQSPG